MKVLNLVLAIGQVFFLSNEVIAAFNVAAMFGVAPDALSPPINLLEGTNIDPSRDNVDLQCCYKASKDGFSATAFHNCVDNRGSALVIALSSTGAVFGGFNPVGWRSTDDYSASSNAWLWFRKGKTDTKIPILQGGNAAIFDYATGGPCFGSSDLQIGSPKAAVMGGFAGQTWKIPVLTPVICVSVAVT
mmetsp:Transcript_15126/g.19765  ORF Transcript_15126/g.19765 Transcript_15126/m.19765 type:complete len:189 (+) Transcript_15126:128-694(+)